MTRNGSAAPVPGRAVLAGDMQSSGCWPGAFRTALETVLLCVSTGNAADLRGFPWAELECDLQRLGRIERAPLTEEACDAICEHFARRQ